MSLFLASDSDSDESSVAASDSSNSLTRDAIVLPWWFSGQSSERLRVFLDYRDTASRFALSKVPIMAVGWGKGRDAMVLCVKTQPVQLWVVGTLQTVSYVLSDVDPRAGCDVTLKLLRDIDRDALSAIYSKARPYPREPHVVFHASRSSKGSEVIELFPNIYDATETYKAKSAMMRLSPRDLVVGDIVLVEATVIRRSVRRGKAQEWSYWDVEFQLDAISRLLPRLRIKKEDTGDNTFDVRL
ncbi:hypothetical protein C2E23DRAFT_868384 [Lenzites betulinus]|nr:hypothetical protein C2E23DRAFT_868384 [Lenzites betulinus]